MINYYQIDISKGDKLYGSVPKCSDKDLDSGIETGSSTVYTLTDNNSNIITADDDLKGDNSRIYFDVNANADDSDHGIVIGQGRNLMGTFAQLEAIPADGYKFIGWYSGDSLVSEDSEYRFCVKEDVSLIAKFELKTVKHGGGGLSQTTPVLSLEKPTESPLESEAPSEADVINKSFSDVKRLTPWAENDINALVKAGIVNGVSETEFAPMDNVTREQFVKMIVGALGLELTNSEIKFSDEQAGQYYIPYIAAAVNNGIVKGISDEKFGIGEDITREDMAVIIHRALGTGETDSGIFKDAAEISGYAKSAVTGLVNSGIITGYEDGTFRPKAAATRAEAAVIINRVLNTLGK